ncbi:MULTISPECIES: hypothetical protein [Acinetobacter]|nr:MULTISPECIES: hypothetical protein [Acinetobacter]OOW13386.1 hypothetical protein MF4640_09915 [Acinetobacter sp. MF4640]PZK61933.1 hypothetical protein C7Q29_15110 [Staphylococcus aureus]
MDIQEENNLIQEAFEVEADEVGFCLDQKWGDYENPYENSDTVLAFNLFKKGWQAAKAQAVPEGFVLVPKENISCYWQDNDEPENFCSNESDFDCLGDCIDLGEIMEINKFTQAHVNKEILFGTWFAEAIDPSEKANFFVGTHAECLEIVAKNKAMIEAQEQSHECPNP